MFGKRRALLVFLLLGVGLAALHRAYPLDYVARVLVRQGSDFEDHRWQPHVTIPEADSPRGLPRNLRPGAVRAAFESHPWVEDLDVFLEDLGSTAFLVLEDGAVVYESYFHGRDERSLQATFQKSDQKPGSGLPSLIPWIGSPGSDSCRVLPVVW